jgi:membrane-associated phospholipid phosphatase
MKFLKDQNVSQIIPFLLYLVFYMIWFSILERLPRTRFFDLSSELDTYIPFIVEFIIPYLSWFLFQAVWVVFVFFVDRKTYEQLTTMLMIGMTVFLVVSTFLPTKISLRPYYIESRGICAFLVRRLWAVDTPTNVWPSIHVFNTTALMMTLFTSQHPLLRKNAVRIPVVFWCGMIVLSTMFLKQHSVGDVLAALALNGIAYVLVYNWGFVVRVMEPKKRARRRRVM